jgi:hypothetical protein
MLVDEGWANCRVSTSATRDWKAHFSNARSGEPPVLLVQLKKAIGVELEVMWANCRMTPLLNRMMQTRGRHLAKESAHGYRHLNSWLVDRDFYDLALSCRKTEAIV